MFKRLTWYGMLLLLLCVAPLRAQEPSSAVLAPKWTAAAFPGLVNIEQAILARTNVERRKRGLAPVRWNTALCIAERQHCREMGQRGYFSHTSPVAAWGTPNQRAYYAGYWGQQVGENILTSRGYRDTDPGRLAAYFVQLWMRSPGHRANILLPEWTCLGVGVVKVGNTYYAGQLFAVPRVELEGAELTGTTGETLALRLTGDGAAEQVKIWVEQYCVRTLQPEDGHIDATLTFANHSGRYALAVSVGHTLVWEAELNTDHADGPVTVTHAVRDRLAVTTATAVTPFTGLRLFATARVPDVTPVLLMRDGEIVSPLHPDAHRRVTLDLSLPWRAEPYVISLLTGTQVEALLFIDTMQPLSTAFRGRWPAVKH